ncbi:MAG: hypothetical protein ACXAEU_13145 [Candidatus Hodarchaeales archaeon]
MQSAPRVREQGLIFPVNLNLTREYPIIHVSIRGSPGLQDNSCWSLLDD